MTTEEIRKTIKKRSTINNEWDYGIQQRRDDILKVLSENLNETINFIENNCTAEEFSWLSEIFNEIIDIFPSKIIIETLRKTAKKFPIEVEKYNINYFINEADKHLDFIQQDSNANR